MGLGKIASSPFLVKASKEYFYFKQFIVINPMNSNMRISIVFLLFHLLISTVSPSAYAQDRYLHLTGSSKNNPTVSADLIITGQKVSGFFHPGLTSPTAVKGELINQDSLVLYQHSSDKVLISGKLNADGKMSGKWSDGNNAQALELSESYPAGTHKLKVLEVSSIQPLVEAADSPFAVFESTVVIPEESMDKAIAERFKSLILSNLFRAKAAVDFKTLLQNEKSAYFDQYRSKNIDINTKENYPLLNWEKRKLMNVVFNASDIISLQFEDYTYTGGSAALQITRYLVINASNGTQIQLSDLIAKEKQAELGKKIRDEICKNLHLEPTGQLTDHGFFSDEVFSSDNFFITDAGIGFQYNTYELANQEIGPISVFLSFDKLGGLLGDSDIVKRVAAK